MQWGFDGNAPIYTQLVDQMKLGIVSGEWIPGQRIPAVRELAVDVGVNPNTMQRALQELEPAGTDVFPAHQRKICNGGQRNDRGCKAYLGKPPYFGVYPADAGAGLYPAGDRSNAGGIGKGRRT